MSAPLQVNTPLLQNYVNADLLSTVVSNLPQAVLLEDDQQIIQLVNKEFCGLFGLKVKPEELTGKNSSGILLQLNNVFVNTSDYIAQATKLVRGKQAHQHEIIELRTGQSLSRDYIPLWQEGIFAGHLWLFSDVTDSIKKEKEIKEQRRFYEDVLNNIPSDIAVFSSDHKYLYINPTGLRDPELRKWLIGKTDFDYCLMRGKDISFAQKRRDVFNDIVATGKEKEWEERIVNKKGEVEYHLRKLSPLYNEKKELVWMIGYSVNITERKKTEQQIQLSEKRYRDLFNYSQAIICTHDLEGNFLSANPSLLEVLGYRENEVIGKNLRHFLLPEDQNGFDDLYLSVIKKENIVKGTFRVLHKTGRKIYLLYQNYKVAESPDGDAYIIAFAQDITERIRAEKELREAKKVTEETARNKEKFLANMSHEIRTPMSGIIGITSLLQKTQLSQEQKNYLEIIQESANDLLSIINDILDLEKAGTGQIQLETIPFKIIHKTQNVANLFKPMALGKGLEIFFENSVQEDLCVIGDPTRFSQVMNNLISNAVKFTHNGKILIKVSKENESTQDITLHFSVEDTGIGIDPANIEKIFQPFTQAYPETARMYGGTGLGLAISKNLVEFQGGSIWVNSKAKQGSSFHFTITYLKCKDVQKDALSAHRQIENTLGPLNILVAEDSELNQFLTKIHLENLGFNVTVAKTGNEALQLYSINKYDLILMDIQMPEKNGIEATSEIRSLHGPKKDIPIIALTANALQGDEETYFAVGMNGFLSKPFTEHALYETIFNVLEKTKNMKQGTAEKLYDLTMVNELARGNQEFILNLAKIFIETVPPTSAEMAEACNQKKWEDMGKLAHKLKSTIDTMNIASLKDEIRAIEKNGKEKTNLEITPQLVEKADSIIKQVAQQLKEEFNL